MNNQFDELAKALAQPIARRAALKRFGVGAAVALLAGFGLTPRAEATTSNFCTSDSQCPPRMKCRLIKGSKYGFCTLR
jgi:hypothetical protein